MGLTKANAKLITALLMDNNIVPTLVELADGTWEVWAVNNNASWTVAQITNAANVANPPAVARSARVQFTNA